MAPSCRLLRRKIVVLVTRVNSDILHAMATMSPLPPWLLLLFPLLVSSTSCPAPCQCKWQEGKYTLNCVDKNITKVPYVEKDLETNIVKLDGNNLNQLEAHEFVEAGFDQVRLLSMKNCKLDKINSEVFSGLNNLHHLDLSHNSLTLLIPLQFPSLPALRRLDLSSNFLHNIHKDSFANLPSLERLDLSGNSLSSISWTTFLPLVNLNRLYLSSNPWHCDCNLGDLHSDLKRRKLIPSDATCSTPQTLSMRQWSSLLSSDFTCPPVVSLPHHQAVVLGQSVPLHCQVEGNPTPTVTWRLDGVTIPSSSGMYNIKNTKSGDGHSTTVFSILTIRNMSSSSIGLLTCTAKNTAGVTEKELRLSYTDEVTESDNRQVTLIVAISVTTVVIFTLVLLIIVLCFVRRMKSTKTRGHSSSFTVLEYISKAPGISKDSEILRPAWTNPMPKPPRTGAYSMISCEDLPGTLSKVSTGLTYFSDTCGDDTSDVDGDNTFSTLPRSEYDWIRHSTSATNLPYSTLPRSLDYSDVFPMLDNRSRSRASIGTISSLSTIDPVYSSTKHPNQHLLRLHSYPPHQTSCHQRPGYVTLPRRPRGYQRPSLSYVDNLGPRTSADGCSYSSISNLHTNKITDRHYCKSNTVLPPYSPPPPASISAINTLGLPPVQQSLQEEDDFPIRTSTPMTPSPSPLSKAQLDTIPEQE